MNRKPATGYWELETIHEIPHLTRSQEPRTRVEQDLDDELRSYIEMAAEERRGAGMPDHEARPATLIELGGVEQVRESVRDVRAGALIDQLRQDIFYAIRMLGRNRGLTAVAVTTLALGIGANTAIFSIVDTVVFRSLPYKDAGRLVKIWGSGSAEPIDNVSFPDFVDIRDQNDVFEQVAADDGTGFTLAPPGGPRRRLGPVAALRNPLPIHPRQDTGRPFSNRL